MPVVGQDSPGHKTQHRTVFIVGATGTIGRQLSLAYAQGGYSLVLHGGHDEAALERLVLACSDAGASQVYGWVEEIRGIGSFLGSSFLPVVVDILVACWGPWARASLGTTTPQMWELMAMANLGLPGALVSRYAPEMAQRGFGRILLFGGSTSDRIQSYRTSGAYGAAKTGLGVIAKSAAREFGSHNVTCNVLCPGYHSQEVAVGTTDPEEKSVESLKTLVDLSLFCSQEVNMALNGAIMNCGSGL